MNPKKASVEKNSSEKNWIIKIENFDTETEAELEKNKIQEILNIGGECRMYMFLKTLSAVAVINYDPTDLHWINAYRDDQGSNPDTFSTAIDKDFVDLWSVDDKTYVQLSRNGMKKLNEFVEML